MPSNLPRTASTDVSILVLNFVLIGEALTR
jgi:hypothetical protein